MDATFRLAGFRLSIVLLRENMDKTEWNILAYIRRGMAYLGSQPLDVKDDNGYYLQCKVFSLNQAVYRGGIVAIVMNGNRFRENVLFPTSLIHDFYCLSIKPT